jgi:hypothetical protein
MMKKACFEHAFAAKHNNKGRQKFGQKRDKRGSQRQSNFMHEDSKKGNFRLGIRSKCYYCGELGYDEKDCKKK